MKYFELDFIVVGLIFLATKKAVTFRIIKEWYINFLNFLMSLSIHGEILSLSY